MSPLVRRAYTVKNSIICRLAFRYVWVLRYFEMGSRESESVCIMDCVFILEK